MSVLLWHLAGAFLVAAVILVALPELRRWRRNAGQRRRHVEQDRDELSCEAADRE